MSDNPMGAKMEMITVSNAVKQVANATYNPITGVNAGLQPLYMLLTNGAGGAIRITFDGTAPVAASIGHLLAAGDTFIVNGKSMMKNLKMIREVGDSIVAITCFF